MGADIEFGLTPAEAVRRVRGLAGVLADDEQALLADACQVLDMAAGETLVAEGTTSDALFIVVEGELDVYTDTPRGERKLRHVGPGAYLGEVSLMDPGPATASVVTDQGCTVLRLDRSRLDGLTREHPKLVVALLKELNRTLAHRISDATALLATLAGPDGDDLTTAPEEGLLAAHGALFSDGGGA